MIHRLHFTTTFSNCLFFKKLLLSWWRYIFNALMYYITSIYYMFTFASYYLAFIYYIGIIISAMATSEFGIKNGCLLLFILYILVLDQSPLYIVLSEPPVSREAQPPAVWCLLWYQISPCYNIAFILYVFGTMLQID